jgi:dTDP-4-dehydrorhamnose reductase
VRRPQPRHAILRTSWLYGELGKNFLKTMVRLAQERKELRVVADQRGSATSTRDLPNAILRIAPCLAAGEDVWETYHFTGSGVTTWHGFASRVVAALAPLTRRKPRVTAITTAEFPTPARRPTNCELDCSRFEQTFGFRARPWAEASPPWGKHRSFREQHLMKPGFKLRRRRPDSIPAFSAVFA